MEKISLTALARQEMASAKAANSGRSAQTVFGGHHRALRQTLVALTAGSGLAEHDSPGEATLQVLQGRVRLTAGPHGWDGSAGDQLMIPNERHALHAIEDSVVLLTVVKSMGPHT